MSVVRAGWHHQPHAAGSAVRVRLDVNDIEAGMLLQAAGARRFAHNWAIAKIKANADPGSVRVRHHERIEALDSVGSV